MLLNDRQSDTIDQNLENINTPGYLQESERVRSFPRLSSALKPSPTNPYCRKKTRSVSWDRGYADKDYTAPSSAKTGNRNPDRCGP
jgi:flagellar basal body rod protein FlgG